MTQMSMPVLTAHWLAGQGYSSHLLQGYCQHGWLQPLARGVYLRAGQSLTWAGALHALQNQKNAAIHLGGRSALDVQGFYHYLRESFDLLLCAPANTKLPAWFMTVLGDRNPTHFVTYEWLKEPSLGLVNITQEDLQLTVSGTARAMLEVCALVPLYYGYEEAAHLMENLSTLDSGHVQALLEASTHFKANRLFLHYAFECAHPWFDKLNLSAIKLGEGRRTLPGASRYDKQFRLYVPETPLNEGWGRENVVF